MSELEKLASLKRLPLDFLHHFGFSDNGKGILIQYGPDARARIRECAETSHPTLWISSDKREMRAFGYQLVEAARRRNDVELIVEGESDVATAVFHGRACIGVPGNTMTHLIKLDDVKCFPRLVIIVEPGAHDFPISVARRLREIGYIGEISQTTVAPFKDISELHLALANEILAPGEKTSQALLDRFATDLNAVIAKAILIPANAKPGNAKSNSVTWTLESAAEIVRRGVPPVEYDVAGLLPSDDGPAILYGPPGALKSYITLHLAACAATGEKFLGHFEVRRRPYAIYLNFDAGKRAFDRRVSRLGFPARNLFVTSPEDFSETALHVVFERHPEAFVALDTLSDMYHPDRGEDQAHAMRRFVRELRRQYADFRCNGFVLDHPHRPRDGAAHGDYYGSIQKEATARTMWQITRLPDTEAGIVRAKIVCRKMSEAEPFVPFVAKIDFRGELILATFDGLIDDVKPSTTVHNDMEMVEQVLRGTPGGMSCSTLKTLSGLPRDRVLQATKQSRRILAKGKGRATRYLLLESSAVAYDSSGDSNTAAGESFESSNTLGFPNETEDFES